MQEDTLLPITHSLLADFQSLPPLISSDHVDDTPNEPDVTTFRYPTLDLDPTAPDPPDPPAMLPRRPSMTRRATSSFIRASARASTVAATPLVHAFWFVLSLIAASRSGEGQTGENVADAGLEDVLGSSERRRRRYGDHRQGHQDTTDIHEFEMTHDDTEERAGDEEEVDRELMLPGGWRGRRSSR